ncbi:TraY domain-containing protein [Serratia bockelmannii]|uniref:Relaxosome protein TraY n=1 Tax=Serratia bockelmannii TaxID=2703793 RepID=A0ABT8LZY8_9GAMM|nr:TraY domain-containing protein [Serratia bockelmannii]MDN6881935.1 TraY domain-containing protein [Serratia bockelmannii]HBH6890280.1 TraY domain-containing protein [Serratia marcescens]
MKNQKSKSEHDYRGISITLHLSPEANRQLSLSARRSGRAKRQEAVIRLQDHLNTITDIASEGKRFIKVLDESTPGE